MTIVPVHAANPGPMTGDGNWTWLLPGAEPTLIDAGTGEQQHLEALDAALAGAPLSQVLVTHAHTDHASGAPALAARFPQARFRKMLWPERDTKWSAPYTAIADGDEIVAGDTTIVAIHTPGHSPDHLSFWHEATRTLFCGDLAVKGTTVWIPARLNGDLADYLASLERVLAMQPSRLMPAHGAVIDDPEKVLRQYIQHRREREQQIVDALERGDTTPEQITDRVYKGLRPHLVPMAREGVVAHLIKLAREGRAREDAGDWTIIRS